MNILDQIVQHKLQEIAVAKELTSENELAARCKDLPQVRDFAAALLQHPIGIIAEVKKASPSAGIIRADFHPVEIAQTYQRAGADCLSVLTDEHFFQGHLQYLVDIRKSVEIPILRKEFILDRYQLLEARSAGADAVLLIAEILPDNRLTELYQQAVELGLQVLVELHDAEQLERVVACGTRLIGINNRDLRTFTTRLDHTIDLLGAIPADRVVISESGIRTHADLVRLQHAGARGVLVGESLMRAPDIAKALLELHQRV